MAKWTWFDRTFNFDYPVGKYPDILERWRGMPAHLAWMIEGVPREVLVATDGAGWSIQQNVGHLIDAPTLLHQRVEQILAGAKELSGADLTNQTTKDANHNDRDIAELMATLRSDREALVKQLEPLGDEAWARASIHPRLKQPMRLVDLIYFDCEHDDYHLARIRELLQKLS